MHVGAVDTRGVIRLKCESLRPGASCGSALRDVLGFEGKTKSHST